MGIVNSSEYKKFIPNKAVSLKTSTTISRIRRENNSVNMPDFSIVDVIGNGGFSDVLLVRKLGGEDDGELYAMKVIDKNAKCSSYKLKRTLAAEKTALRIIRGSPFCIMLHYSFETKNQINLVMDYISGGNLYDYLKFCGRFTEEACRFYIGEFILALEHLHSIGVIHRDVKLENTLLDDEGHIVLVDFGLCKIFKKYPKLCRTNSLVGTPGYTAPEVYRRDYYSYEVDWWSLGVVAYELLVGIQPFTGETSEMIGKVLQTPPEFPSFVSPEAKDLVLRLLHKDPEKRLGKTYKRSTALKTHAFFKGMKWRKLLKQQIKPPVMVSTCKRSSQKHAASM